MEKSISALRDETKRMLSCVLEEWSNALAEEGHPGIDEYFVSFVTSLSVAQRALGQAARYAEERQLVAKEREALGRENRGRDHNSRFYRKVEFCTKQECDIEDEKK